MDYIQQDQNKNQDSFNNQQNEGLKIKQNYGNDYNSEQDLEKPNHQKKLKSNINDEVIYFESNKDNKDAVIKGVDVRKITPWVKANTLNIKNPIIRLHNEIIDFCEYIAPTKTEHRSRMNSVNKLKGFIQEEIVNCDVQCFGSFQTQLYLPNGDIDMVILQEEALDSVLFNKVSQLLDNHKDCYHNILKISHAKVPIIKFVEIGTNFSYDISFNQKDGLKQLNEVEKGLSIYPEMKYLIFVMKCILRQRDLHETFSGGVGSFLLFCLILTFLRETRRQYSQQNKLNDLQNVTLGEYLLKFFDFYTNNDRNDWKRKKIIMTEGGAIVDKDKDDGKFSLVSPQDPNHDIGNSAYNIKDVFSVLKNRYLFLTNYNFQQGESILKYIVNPSNQVFTYLKEEDL